MALSTKEKIRKISDALPGLNCGLCGFGNCGQFARAVAEGRASPFGCRQNPASGFQISKIMGQKVPGYSEESLPALRSPEKISPYTTQRLREELRPLLQKTDDLLARIEKLKARS
jgi:Na+-translocating ferredoxin:NAD+ oxidoreductase RNF subunit RnfB